MKTLLFVGLLGFAGYWLWKSQSENSGGVPFTLAPGTNQPIPVQPLTLAQQQQYLQSGGTAQGLTLIQAGFLPIPAWINTTPLGIGETPWGAPIGALSYSGSNPYLSAMCPSCVSTQLNAPQQLYKQWLMENGIASGGFHAGAQG